MSNLRNKAIRLAHEKPELRKHLLPLLHKPSMERTALDYSSLPWWNYLNSNVADFGGFIAEKLGEKLKRLGAKVSVNPGRVLGKIDFVLAPEGSDRPQQGTMSFILKPSMDGGVPSGELRMEWAGGVTTKKFPCTVKIRETPEDVAKRLLVDIAKYHEHPGEPNWPK